MNVHSTPSSIPAWPRLPRPAVLVASLIGTALVVLLAHGLAHLTLGVIVFGMASALTYGLAVRLGASLALTGGLGVTLGHLLQGQSLQASLLPGLGIGLGALLVVGLIKVLPRGESVLIRRLRMLGFGLLLIAPISALGYWLTGAPHHPPGLLPAQRFLFLMASECFGIVLFTPIVLTLLPDAAGNYSTLALSARPARVAMVITGLLLATAHVLGMYNLVVPAQVVLFLMAAVAMAPVFLGSERASALMVAASSLGMTFEQAILIRGGAQLTLLTAEQRMVALGALLTLGAIVLHLLNAVAIRGAQQRQELEAQVFKNPFSGLPNRRHFFKMLNELASQRERPNTFFAEVAIPDLHFLAEFSGREAVYRADTVIAQTLDQSLRPFSQYLSHAALGSYFVELQTTADPLAVIDAVEAAVAQASMNTGVHRMRVRPQIALLRVPAELELDGEDIQSSLSLALQRSDKSLKRWSMSTLQQSMLQKQRDDIHESEVLVDLLSQSQVLVFAQIIQPVQEMRDQGLHFEVLARMKGADGQVISPARFLPAYTAYGLLPQFDREVIQHVFDLLNSEPQLVRAIKACSINLTGPTIADPDLMPFIEAQFAGALIEPSQVIFEITESNHISSRRQALENVAELRALGCSIALDDFGTGLATFDYLKSFKPDWIKIDGSFVREAGANAINREVVSSMIRVAKAAGARAVAEQVEHQKDIDLMQALGAHYVQGYAIAKPEPLINYAERLRQQAAGAARDAAPAQAAEPTAARDLAGSAGA